jgi:hypothetical protein
MVLLYLYLLLLTCHILDFSGWFSVEECFVTFVSPIFVTNLLQLWAGSALSWMLWIFLGKGVGRMAW